MTLENFKKEVVNGWMKQDVERMMMEIRIKGGKPGNINYPLGLCVLAYMESLGAILLGGGRTFEQKVKKYLDECFSCEANAYHPALLLIFRDALAHEYFSQCGISRDGKRPPTYIKEGLPMLDVETLTRDFLKSLTKFNSIVSEDMFQCRMNSCANRFRRKINSKMVKEVVADLPERNSGEEVNLSAGASHADIKTISTLRSLRNSAFNTTTLPDRIGT